jgi:hypothetical protein
MAVDANQTNSATDRHIQQVKERNEKTSVVDWQFKSADARTKLKRLYPSELAG